jgi:hypothetical protein
MTNVEDPVLKHSLQSQFLTENDNGTGTMTQITVTGG